MEYKILSGDSDRGGPHASRLRLLGYKIENLETQVNRVISIGGSTVGGIIIKDNYPYQAVMIPKASSNTEPTNPVSFTRAVRSAGGAPRKSKKSRKTRKI